MASASRRPRTPQLDRHTVPEQLPGATEFSSQHELYSALWLVGLVKSCSFIWKPLNEATTRTNNSPNPRGPGSWALLYLAFVSSRYPDVEPWYATVLAEQPALWKACGFKRLYAYKTVWERFAELEDNADAFANAAAAVIQLARRKDPRVGAWWHMDATEAETHASPVHDCRRGENCPGSTRSRLGKLDTDHAQQIREAQDALPPDAPDPQVTVSGVTSKQLDTKVWDAERGGWRLRLGGHWWFSRDPDAGTRAYSRGTRTLRVWHGYYNDKAIDHYTGGTLAAHVFPADRVEAHEYPTLYAKARHAIGGDPLAIAGDRGLALQDVYRHNTLRNVASCFPYRRTNQNAPPKAAPGARWDEHGIPTCAYCGGGSDFVRFHSDGSRARLWFRCALPQQTGCTKDQSISCANDWSRLLPLWRTQPAYHAMRETHTEYERVHGHTRRRYLIGPDNLAIRPKRVSMAGHQLRSNAGILIEWLRITTRQGWLGSSGRNAAPRKHQPRGMHRTITRHRTSRGRTGGNLARPNAQPPP